MHIGKLLDQNASTGASLVIIGHSPWCLIVRAGKSCLDQFWDNFKTTFIHCGTILGPPGAILAPWAPPWNHWTPSWPYTNCMCGQSIDFIWFPGHSSTPKGIPFSHLGITFSISWASAENKCFWRTLFRGQIWGRFLIIFWCVWDGKNYGFVCTGLPKITFSPKLQYY